jgi:hypothetical protein
VAIGEGTDDVVFALDAFNTDPTGTIPDGAMFYDADGDVFRCRINGSWVNCSGAAGGNTVTIVRIPEFEGATLNADGGSNSGSMTSDFINGLSSGEGEKHNYYEWSTSQTSAQDYDIIVNFQIPSDYSTGLGSFTFWHRDPDGATTNASTTITIYDQDETVCRSALAYQGTTSNVWEEESVTLSTCTYAANDVLTVVFHLQTTSGAGAIRLGEFEYQYTN